MLLAAELIGAAALLARPAAQQPLVVGDHRVVVWENHAGPPGDELLSRVAVEIGPAVEAVEAFWGTDWPHRITVTAAGSNRQFATLAGGEAGADITQWSDVAAVAVADRVDPAHRLAVGQRVVFAPDAVAMSTPSLRIVLTHELFHYAARADTAIDAPRWLTEGVADFVARPTEVPAGQAGFAVGLPTDADLDTPGERRAQAYDRAWAFAHFVAARFGPDSLRRLYLAGCGPDHSDVATAVYRVLGGTLPEVLADWQRTLAHPVG